MKKNKITRQPAQNLPRIGLQELRKKLNEALIDRKQEIDGLIIALLAREHILLLGPPGVGKTKLAKLLNSAISGCSIFTYLLSKFTVPEELFGPFSMQGFKQDQYRRITAGKLPTASLAFVDEIYKSNSAILNSLLMILNERLFDNGGQVPDQCPLETLVGASNELPESGELDALHDRFLLRYWTGYISDKNSMRTLLLQEDIEELPKRLSLEDLHFLQAEVDQVTISADIVDVLLTLKVALEKEGFYASDRRWVKCLRILQAQAYLNGKDEVQVDDLLVLQHVLWKEPKDRGALSRLISKIANPVAHAAQEILDSATELFKSLPIGQEIEQSKTASVFTAIVDANGTFKAQVAKLNKLGNGARPKEVTEAMNAIENMSQEASRFAAKVSGLTLS